MCSPICWHDKDFISEIRCLQYASPTERGASVNEALPRNVDDDNTISLNSADDLKPQKTHFSVGSIAAQDPIKFIGPLENFEVVRTDTKISAHDVTYHTSGGNSFRVAPEHEVFFQQQRPHHGLHHSHVYCRRALKDCTFHEALSPAALKRWDLANLAVDEIWQACEQRPDYKPYFFTTATIGRFVGELVYLVERVPNFPGLSYLGSVNVHRDALKSVAAFAGSAYGGLHLSAWNDFFPTQVERWLWMACSLATGASGIVLALFFVATQKVRVFEKLEHFVRNSVAFRKVGAWVVTPLFLAARVFIVVEAFVSLRQQPKAVYKTTEWTDYLPHF